MTPRYSKEYKPVEQYGGSFTQAAREAAIEAVRLRSEAMERSIDPPIYYINCTAGGDPGVSVTTELRS